MSNHKKRILDGTATSFVLIVVAFGVLVLYKMYRNAVTNPDPLWAFTIMLSFAATALVALVYSIGYVTERAEDTYKD